MLPLDSAMTILSLFGSARALNIGTVDTSDEMISCDNWSTISSRTYPESSLSLSYGVLARIVNFEGSFIIPSFVSTE